VESGIYKAVQTPKYDILRETWIYQEIKQEVVSEEHQHFLQTQRQLLIEIVEARFPRLLSLATSIVSSITEVSALHSLILCISTARLEKEARLGLTNADQTKEKIEAANDKISSTWTNGALPP
jgi:hypothetical protein